ncbi:MAG: NAD(+) diphosphatase [Clostridiales bacterium]|nr:NAD(+) diphosphatase [Clostridiales bacterium]
MIHEIHPYLFRNEYRAEEVGEDDYIFCFQGRDVYLLENENELIVPKFSQMTDQNKDAYVYLFAINEIRFFLHLSEDGLPLENGKFYDLDVFRKFSPKHIAFAGVTASHLYRFHESRHFCGRCGTLMEKSEKERALLCPGCGMTEYPKISPAVIIAIIDGDKILLTKYAKGRYKNYALVAGYVEVGESFEDTVNREVMEEVGLRVKNITYYKSQPWSFTDTMMIGFFAQLDGDNKITRQEEELAEAGWFQRDEIPESDTKLSIGQEMIDLFKSGKSDMLFQ